MLGHSSEYKSQSCEPLSRSLWSSNSGEKRGDKTTKANKRSAGHEECLSAHEEVAGGAGEGGEEWTTPRRRHSGLGGASRSDKGPVRPGAPRSGGRRPNAKVSVQVQTWDWRQGASEAESCRGGRNPEATPRPRGESASYPGVNFSRARGVVFLRFVNFIQNTSCFKANHDVGGWLQTNNFSVMRRNEPRLD